ncbi:hypothetical protein ACIQ9E_10640 [Streptomyces sp. NPDC094448]|uniref:hypothetical protein n=1 Tax=Streptomyces sp. NPDC094448 TaxID=3366063 RepID=UPI00382D2F3E
MNALHQHMIDSYRATAHGTRLPPRPGTLDWQATRELASQAPLARRRRRSLRERWAGRGGSGERG